MDFFFEIYYVIFDFFDLIDSICFGLINFNFYFIYCWFYGIVLLVVYCVGFNELEWVWYLVG